MKIHKLNNNNVEVGVIEECGHLFPVRFFFDYDVIEPMHISPWLNEEHDPETPPMLRYLRGDFFCAPFGDSDLLPDEQRAHGTPANDTWNKVEKTESLLKFKLAKKVSGSELTKAISIRENEHVVYQKHIFSGGQGKLPIGHHAMLKIPEKAFISFSDYQFGGTPPVPVESDPSKGNSILKYPQQFQDLTSVEGSDNRLFNTSVYPFDKDHEDLLMLISEDYLPFGWSAVSNPSEGWLWYSIKNINILPNTVIWMSNGGRYYPPFSSRHKNVIGVEETRSFFHLGHKASVESNFLNQKGFNTYIELSENIDIEVPYIFGVARIPGSFSRVKTITETENGIEITDINVNKITARVDLNFIRNIK
jgi:hypothetical protein